MINPSLSHPENLFDIFRISFGMIRITTKQRLIKEEVMSKVCDICGKGKMAGMKIKRRGMAKKDGGVGRKITGRSIRRFTPNLQKVKVNMKGVIKTIKVCTACIRSGKITKA